MIKVAQGFAEKPDSMYKINKYQVLLAASLAVSDSPKQALRLQAGGGKTFVILLLGQYLLNEGKKVRIVVPNKLILKQTQLDLDLYIANDDIEIIIINDLKYDANDSYCYLCDEIDAMLEKAALLVTKEESRQENEEHGNWICGLASVYHSEKACFFSATYDSYHKKLLR